MYDILFRNCTCLDLTTGKERLYDVGVSEGRISSVREHAELATSAKKTIDCSGNYLFPGFIDFHTHLFAHGSTFGMDADRLMSAGITTAVDMGTAGWVNYPAFHKCDLEGKHIRLKSFLNISPIGQPGKGINEPLMESVISEENIENTLKDWPGEIVGIKVRISRSIVGDLGLKPLQRAVEIAGHFGLPTCVHTTDPPSSTADIVKILRPEDIYSHTYHGEGNTILGSDGHVLPEILRARDEGLLFEVGNGRKNFAFSTAEPALKDGLFPALITSDSTATTFHKDPCMWDLPFVMSKFLFLGMSLPDVIRSVTETPAKCLGISDRFGAIREGYTADLTLCRVSEEEIHLLDSSGNERTGHVRIKPLMTIIDGQIVFRDELN